MLQDTGAVSIVARQFAQLMATHVIITERWKLTARAKQLGMHLVNYKTDPWVEKKVVELNGGGVGQFVEVGGPGTLARSLRAIGVGGEVMMIVSFQVIPGNVQAMNRAVSGERPWPIIDKISLFDERWVMEWRNVYCGPQGLFGRAH
jgi:NADPH:quinone reductase-like Zn-dependent oxidoreductase